jgi:hypothetical protein
VAKIDTKLTGSAGEHYACSMLARHGWAPSLTRDGLERTDILAVHSLERWLIEVQVKTIRSGRWMLGRKGLLPDRSGHEWYVFVRLDAPPATPACFVVPRDHVAAATWVQHQAWLTAAGIPSGTRNTPVDQARVGAEIWSGYREAWEQLGQDARKVDIRLPTWMRDAMHADGVGLPEGHPWLDATRVPDWTGPEPYQPSCVDTGHVASAQTAASRSHT